PTARWCRFRSSRSRAAAWSKASTSSTTSCATKPISRPSRRGVADVAASAIEIFDTTLRDGTQKEGLSLSAAEKLRVAVRLDQLGVHFIEGGWPGSNPK